jgi:hypothetical protein
VPDHRVGLLLGDRAEDVADRRRAEGEGGDLEVDPAEAARQLAEAEAAKAARVREQEVQGEAMRRAQEMSVAAGRRAVAATATAAAEERI